MFEFRRTYPIEAAQLVKLILAGNYTTAAQRSSARTTSTRTSYNSQPVFSVPWGNNNVNTESKAITDLSSDTIIANGQPVIIIPYPDKKVMIARGPAEIIEEIQILIAEPTEYKENGHDTFSGGSCNRGKGSCNVKHAALVCGRTGGGRGKRPRHRSAAETDW